MARGSRPSIIGCWPSKHLSRKHSCDSPHFTVRDAKELPVDLANESFTKRNYSTNTTVRDRVFKPVGNPPPTHQPLRRQQPGSHLALTAEEESKLAFIRANLPIDAAINTPFGSRRVCYCDYTASGRPLKYIEEYISSVVAPLFANTHTETSATGLQTTHFREEARQIVLDAFNANAKDHVLIFVGSGCTGAINKFMHLMNMHVPFHLRELVKQHRSDELRPLVFISPSEHHSNELMWRESLCEVRVIAHEKSGEVSDKLLRAALEEEKARQAETGVKRLVVGSFTAASNVTGLRTNVYVISALLHEYGAIAAWDFAAAAPYVDINVNGDPYLPNSHLDAAFVSPHKFVGGPGTPGILVARRRIFPSTTNAPPTIPGGGTVLMVWQDGGVVYERDLLHREEAGTPDILGSIRCGLVYQLRAKVGIKLIEKIEGSYAQRAVKRFKAAGNIWVMGDHHTNVDSASMRLSITSFNIYIPEAALADAPPDVADKLKGKMLHPHFVAALLNDLYGIQARSGCSCAGPLAVSLFEPMVADGFQETLVKNSEAGFHAYKPGWARVNFNFFITEAEFDFVCTAIEQIASHGYKLLPLYALCLKTGQYFFNNRYDRFDGVRTLAEIKLEDESVTWKEPVASTRTFAETLDKALEVYASATERVNGMLHRFRDLRRQDTVFPPQLTAYRFFALGSEVLPLLGVTNDQVEQLRSIDDNINPVILAFPNHNSANPMLTFGRPTG